MEKVNLRKYKYTAPNGGVKKPRLLCVQEEHWLLPASSILRIPAHQRSSIQCHWLLLCGETGFLALRSKRLTYPQLLKLQQGQLTYVKLTLVGWFPETGVVLFQFCLPTWFFFHLEKGCSQMPIWKNGLHLKSVRWDLNSSSHQWCQRTAYRSGGANCRQANAFHILYPWVTLFFSTQESIDFKIRVLMFFFFVPTMTCKRASGLPTWLHG